MKFTTTICDSPSNDDTNSSHTMSVDKESNESIPTDGPPDDVQAYFGHPLTLATDVINGDSNAKASGAALLHEYINLPAIDRQDQKSEASNHPRQTVVKIAGEITRTKNIPTSKCETMFPCQPKLENSVVAIVEEIVETSKTPVYSQVNEAIPSLSVIKEVGLLTSDQQNDEEELKEGRQLTETSADVLINQSSVAHLEASYHHYSLPINRVTVSAPALSTSPIAEAKTDLITEQTRAASDAIDIPTTKEDNPKKALAEMLKSKASHQMMSGHTGILDTSHVQGFIDEALQMPQEIITYGVKSDGYLKQLNTDMNGFDNGLHVTETSAVCHSTLPHDNSYGSIVQSTQGQYFQVLQPVPTTDTTATCMNNLYYNQNFHFNKPLDQDKHVDIERYIQQQQTYSYPNHGYAHYGATTGDIDNMKSPDSGYQEPCLSPATGTMAMKDLSGYLDNNMNKTKSPAKRRRSSNVGLYVRQYSTPDKHGRGTIIQKLDTNPAGYRYFLESPISTTQKIDEDRITYLNKSQYYGLTLENINNDRLSKTGTVKSIIMLVFREHKSPEDERKAFEFWHSRQHSYKQRLLDIDTKNSHGIGPGSIEERAFNAVVIKWNPRDGQVKVNIAANCLSTDFSNQKGVKGISLHVQIDTFEDNHSCPVHRGYCQIKVFCDKGAERKTRDEERRKSTKNKTENYSSRNKQPDMYHTQSERSEFYSMADLQTIPAFFSPALDHLEYSYKSQIDTSPLPDEDRVSSVSDEERFDGSDQFYQPAKRHCRYPKDTKVLLYVKEQHEQAFTALMLKQPTVQCLLQAIEEKYHTTTSKTKNLYKKSIKGILVKMDDNIVQHYSHESTFIIELNHISENQCDIVLIELEIQT